MVNAADADVAGMLTMAHMRPRAAAVMKAVGWNVVTAVLYFAAAILAFRATVPGTSIALFWPSSGIAVALGIIAGPHVAIGVFASELVFESVAFGSIAGGGALALANATLVLAVVVAARRFGGRQLFRSPAAVAKFFGAVLASTLVCTTVAVTTMLVSGGTTAQGYPVAWFTWWIGDVVSILLVTPTILLWGSRADAAAAVRGRPVEFTSLVAASVALAFVFGAPFLDHHLGIGMATLALPLVVWSAFRFGPAAGSVTTLVVSAGAMARVFFFPIGENGLDMFLQIEVFIAFVGATGLVLSATVVNQERVVREAAAREFAAVDATRNRLLSSFAHELNNPLTPMMLQLDLIQRSSAGFDADQRRSVAMIDRNVKRLAKLVRDLRDVSHIQSGRGLRIRSGVVDLAKAATAAVEEHRAVASERGVTLVLEAHEVLSVAADADRVSQVFGNLLSNAIKYSPPGGTVRIAVRREGDAATASVIDEGPGLAAEQIARLFEPFSQVQAAEHQKAGTGLGLFISHGIVAQHGGTLTCESRPDGAAFHVRIPLASPPLRGTSVAAPHPCSTGVEPSG
ncbi:MAG TPA: ATP-binding protein [Candidatus Thermoplasmatota archaeon]|nr:ATP-binding protein [Candidatus Thermoplasmatota archaeon]